VIIQCFFTETDLDNENDLANNSSRDSPMQFTQTVEAGTGSDQVKKVLLFKPFDLQVQYFE
jgi:hypothetical protein